MFISLSGVIGKMQNEVISSLSNYARQANDGLKPDKSITSNDQNCCVLQELAGNTSILYPYGYVEWDESSAFISKELNTTVFSFHIHDGDFWMYTLYVIGGVVDKFNPIPDYWDEEISEEEFESWKGNANLIAELIPGLNQKSIKKVFRSMGYGSRRCFQNIPGR